MSDPTAQAASTPRPAHVRVETGSFNYSPNAEKNSFENSNWFDVPEMAVRYAAFFERMFLQGVKPRKPKREPKWKPSKDEA